MQSTAAGFTAEERDSVRKIAHNLLVSWKKDTNLASTTFTIGVSMIGGDDGIGINPGSIGSPNIYNYFDETNYVTQLDWERQLSMPIGGMTKALAEAELDNTSGRFLPRYMGGSSELYTAILPRDPFIINSGFNYGGVDQTLPQFAGITTKQPAVDTSRKRVRIEGADFIDYFQNRYLDKSAMFTNETSDTILRNVFTQLGMATAQFRLDNGINVIPFGAFEKGSKYSDIINDIVASENGYLFQDESGKIRFWNRQHWDNAPYNTVQRVIYTADVINAQAPNDDHIINVVEIKGDVYQRQTYRLLYNMPALTFITVPANSFVDQFFDIGDSILQIVDPTNGGNQSYYKANSNSDSTGIDRTSSIIVTNLGTFTTTVKYRFRNTTANTIYITQFVLSGRVAKKVNDLYYREQDDSSVTAYQERTLTIDNKFIQNIDWAKSYARMILDDLSNPENIQILTILAKPSLQLGDLVSWQGRYWRIFGIKSKLGTSSGFVQELTLLQKTVTSYFRIGISTIGGADRISG